MAYRDLAVLDAADRAADLVNELIDRPPHGRLLHARQLRDAVASVGANIREGFGRGTGRDRDRPLEIARGEAEEAIGTSQRTSGRAGSRRATTGRGATCSS
jgi:four helix bundle protein